MYSGFIKTVEFEKAYIVEDNIRYINGEPDIVFEEVEVARSYCGFSKEEKVKLKEKYPKVYFEMDSELDV